MTPTGAPGPFEGLLETCLYHDTAQRPEVERFYGEVLGLQLVAERSGPISAHGSHGPGHACLLAGGAGRYEAWRRRLEAEGVEITHEHAWGGERRSFYFADPAGNLLEIADGDLWPAA